MKIVLVEWRDIVGQFGWFSQNQVDKFVTDNDEGVVQQVGFLYEEDEDQIVLLDSFFNKKDQFGTITKIPKGCVLKMTVLKNNPTK